MFEVWNIDINKFSDSHILANTDVTKFEEIMARINIARRRALTNEDDVVCSRAFTSLPNIKGVIGSLASINGLHFW